MGLPSKLVERATALPRASADLRFLVCARERVVDDSRVEAVTAADIFSPG